MGPVKMYDRYSFFLKEKFKRNLNDSDSSDNETEEPFPRFIIIESNRALITNLSSFIIEKNNINKFNANYSQKIKKSNFNCRGGKWKHADFLQKMSVFYNISVKTYPYKSLNVNKGVVRSINKVIAEMSPCPQLLC